VKIYVAAVEALTKKERQTGGWNSVYHQICWKNESGSQLFRFVKFSFPVNVFDILLCRNWPLSPLKSGDFTDNSLYPVLNQSCNPGIHSYCSWRALYMIEHYIHVTSHGIQMMMALVFYTWPKIFLASPGFTCELFVLGKGWEEPDWIRNILFWKYFHKMGKTFPPKKNH